MTQIGLELCVRFFIYHASLTICVQHSAVSKSIQSNLMGFIYIRGLFSKIFIQFISVPYPCSLKNICCNCTTFTVNAYNIYFFSSLCLVCNCLVVRLIADCINRTFGILETCVIICSIHLQFSTGV
jgi:hypothetical protein